MTTTETMTTTQKVFDPVAFKQTTRIQWDGAADAWNRWAPLLTRWLGPATELMLDMTNVQPGSRVLDVAAGAGEQTLAAARRTGPSGYVLATDLSPVILAMRPPTPNWRGSRMSKRGSWTARRLPRSTQTRSTRSSRGSA